MLPNNFAEGFLTCFKRIKRARFGAMLQSQLGNVMR